MSELEDKINNVLSSPDQMAQLTQMAKSLMDSGALGDLSGIMGGAGVAPPAQENHQPAPAPASASPPQEAPAEQAAEIPDLSGLDFSNIGGMLGGLDPKLITTLGGIMAKSQTASQKQPLLNAMMPYMSEKRRDKLQRAMQLAKLARVAGAAFGGLGELGGDQ